MGRPDPGPSPTDMADQAELEAIGALGALAGGPDDQVDEGW